jgi:hypothetical protein
MKKVLGGNNTYTKLDDNVSFSLIRTNPVLTTNVKLMYDGDNIYLESYNADTNLSTLDYKHKKVSSNGLFNQDIKDFWSGTVSSIYKTYHKSLDTTTCNNVDNIYENTYWCGVEPIISELYDQEYGCIAPLYLKEKLPTNFVIFKIVDSDNTAGSLLSGIHDENSFFKKNFTLLNDTNIKLGSLTAFTDLKSTLNSEFLKYKLIDETTGLFKKDSIMLLGVDDEQSNNGDNSTNNTTFSDSVYEESEIEKYFGIANTDYSKDFYEECQKELESKLSQSDYTSYDLTDKNSTLVKQYGYNLDIRPYEHYKYSESNDYIVNSDIFDSDGYRINTYHTNDDEEYYNSDIKSNVYYDLVKISEITETTDSVQTITHLSAGLSKYIDDFNSNRLVKSFDGSTVYTIEGNIIKDNDDNVVYYIDDKDNIYNIFSIINTDGQGENVDGVINILMTSSNDNSTKYYYRVTSCGELSSNSFEFNDKTYYINKLDNDNYNLIVDDGDVYPLKNTLEETSFYYNNGTIYFVYELIGKRNTSENYITIDDSEKIKTYGVYDYNNQYIYYLNSDYMIYNNEMILYSKYYDYISKLGKYVFHDGYGNDTEYFVWDNYLYDTNLSLITSNVKNTPEDTYVLLDSSEYIESTKGDTDTYIFENIYNGDIKKTYEYFDDVTRQFNVKIDGIEYKKIKGEESGFSYLKISDIVWWFIDGDTDDSETKPTIYNIQYVYNINNSEVRNIKNELCLLRTYFDEGYYHFYKTTLCLDIIQSNYSDKFIYNEIEYTITYNSDNTVNTISTGKSVYDEFNTVTPDEFYIDNNKIYYIDEEPCMASEYETNKSVGSQWEPSIAYFYTKHKICKIDDNICYIFLSDVSKILTNSDRNVYIVEYEDSLYDNYYKNAIMILQNGDVIYGKTYTYRPKRPSNSHVLPNLTCAFLYNNEIINLVYGRDSTYKISTFNINFNTDNKITYTSDEDGYIVYNGIQIYKLNTNCIYTVIDDGIYNYIDVTKVEDVKRTYVCDEGYLLPFYPSKIRVDEDKTSYVDVIKNDDQYLINFKYNDIYSSTYHYYFNKENLSTNNVYIPVYSFKKNTSTGNSDILGYFYTTYNTLVKGYCIYSSTNTHNPLYQTRLKSYNALYKYSTTQQVYMCETRSGFEYNNNFYIILDKVVNDIQMVITYNSTSNKFEVSGYYYDNKYYDLESINNGQTVKPSGYYIIRSTFVKVNTKDIDMYIDIEDIDKINKIEDEFDSVYINEQLLYLKDTSLDTDNGLYNSYGNKCYEIDKVNNTVGLFDTKIYDVYNYYYNDVISLVQYDNDYDWYTLQVCDNSKLIKNYTSGYDDFETPTRTGISFYEYRLNEQSNYKNSYITKTQYQTLKTQYEDVLKSIISTYITIDYYLSSHDNTKIKDLYKNIIKFDEYEKIYKRNKYVSPVNTFKNDIALQKRISQKKKHIYKLKSRYCNIKNGGKVSKKANLEKLVEKLVENSVILATDIYILSQKMYNKDLDLENPSVQWAYTCFKNQYSIEERVNYYNLFSKRLSNYTINKYGKKDGILGLIKQSEDLITYYTRISNDAYEPDDYYVYINGDNNISLLEDYEYDILQKSSIVKNFDISENSVLGQYIRNYISQSGFNFDQPMYVNFDNKQIYYYGIDLSTGVLTQKVVDFEDNLINADNTITRMDDYITTGYEKNGLVYPYILNLEFLFDDADDNYKFCRYYGMFCNTVDLYENIYDKQEDIKTFSYKPKVTSNFGLLYESKDMVDEGKKKTSQIVKIQDINNKNNIFYSDGQSVFYAKDKYNTLYKLPHTRETLYSNVISFNKNTFDKAQVLINSYLNDTYNFPKVSYRHISDSSIQKTYFNYVDPTDVFNSVGNEKMFGYKTEYVSAGCQYLNEYGYASFGFIVNKNPHNATMIRIRISDMSGDTPNTEFELKLVAREEIIDSNNYTGTYQGSVDKYFPDKTIMTAGTIHETDNYVFFSSNGDVSQIAHAICEAVNSYVGDDYYIDAYYNSKGMVVFRYKYHGSRYNGNVGYGKKIEVIFDGTYIYQNIITVIGNRYSKSDADNYTYTFTGGNDNMDTMFLVPNSDIDIITHGNGEERFIRTYKDNEYARILSIVPYVKDGVVSPDYSVMSTDSNGKYIYINDLKKIELRERYYPKIGVLNFFPVKDFDFDVLYSFYGESTSLNDEIDLSLKRLQLPHTVTNWVLDTGDSDVEIQSDDITTYSEDTTTTNKTWKKISEVIKTTNVTSLNNLTLYKFINSSGLTLTNEYSYFTEYALPTISTVSKTVPYISKWGYIGEGRDSCENIYRLNMSKVFGRLNFSSDTFSLDTDINSYTHCLPYYVIPKYMTNRQGKYEKIVYPFDSEFYQYIDYGHVGNDFITDDIYEYIEQWKNKLLNFTDDDFYEMFVESEDNKRTNKKYSIISGGNSMSNAYTMFRGVRFDIKETVKKYNNGKTVYVNNYTGKYNGYKFSYIFIPLYTKNDVFPTKVYFVKNDNCKFICGLQFVNVYNSKMFRNTNIINPTDILFNLTYVYNMINGNFRKTDKQISTFKKIKWNHKGYYTKDKKMNVNTYEIMNNVLCSVNVVTSDDDEKITPEQKMGYEYVVEKNENIGETYGYGYLYFYMNPMLLNQYVSIINPEYDSYSEKYITNLTTEGLYINSISMRDLFEQLLSDTFNLYNIELHLNDKTYSRKDLTYSNECLYVNDDSFELVDGQKIYMSLVVYIDPNYLDALYKYDETNGDDNIETLCKSYKQICNTLNNYNFDDEEISNIYKTYSSHHLKEYINTGTNIEYLSSSNITDKTNIDFNIYVQEPSKINTLDLFESEVDENDETVSLVNKCQQYIQTVYRYNGYYEPIVKDIIFYNDIQTTDNSLRYTNSSFDMNYSDDYGEFGVIKNLYYHMYNSSKLLSSKSRNPLSGDFALRMEDYNIFSNIGGYDTSGNLQCIKDDKSMFGSKYMGTPLTINIQKLNKAISWKSYTTDYSIDSSVDMVYKETNNVVVEFYLYLKNRTFRYFNTHPVLNKSLNYIKDVYLSEYSGSKKIQLFEDFKKQYIEKNIINLYMVDTVTLWVRSKLVDVNNESINNNYTSYIGYTEANLIKKGFEKVNTYKVETLDGDYFNRKITYYLKYGYREDFAFTYTLKKI